MTDQPDGGPILSCRQVADMLGLHPNTVKRIDPASLPFFRAVTRGDRRYRLADVETYRARMSEWKGGQAAVHLT